MKFKKDALFIQDSFDATKGIEGGDTWIFAQRALANANVDCSECNFFEVGPKHGLHTVLIDAHQPKSITCVEAPNKLRSNERYLRENRTWIPHIKTENFYVHYQDFDKFVSEDKYDLLFYAGVMYHNINQIGQLKRLHALASEDAYMVFESSTTRNEKFIDENVIELHYPPYSPANRAQTCVLHPSKLACKSMLDMTGWEVIETSDDYDDIANIERINILCRKGTQRKNRHLTDDNLKDAEA
mgnify:CR=1 FL=1